MGACTCKVEMSRSRRTLEKRTRSCSFVVHPEYLLRQGWQVVIELGLGVACAVLVDELNFGRVTPVHCAGMLQQAQASSLQPCLRNHDDQCVSVLSWLRS